MARIEANGVRELGDGPGKSNGGFRDESRGSARDVEGEAPCGEFPNFPNGYAGFLGGKWRFFASGKGVAREFREFRETLAQVISSGTGRREPFLLPPNEVR
jgi:hypothetical protein